MALCRDNKLPILVFDVTADNAIKNALMGESTGTLVSSTPSRQPV